MREVYDIHPDFNDVPLPIGLTERPVELTFNWQDAGFPKARFSYYDDLAFRVRRVHPLGGPAAGGSLLHVYLYDDRLLVDLGGPGTWGPRCRFSGPVNSTTGEALSPNLGHLHQQEVLANLTNCGGKRSCGAGWAAMSWWCPSGRPGRPVGRTQLSWLRCRSTPRLQCRWLLLSGPAYPKVMFTLYDPFTTRVDSFTPRAGPLVGGTHITLRGSGFDRFGDTRCQFGPLNLEVNASVLGPELMRCDSPSSWMNGDLSAPTVGFTASPLALTLNGQDYLAMLTYEEQLAGDQHPGRLYTHFSMDSLLGLSVASIRPTGGPPVGGTRVTVSGTGSTRHRDAPSLLFGPTAAATVDATIVDAHT